MSGSYYVEAKTNQLETEAQNYIDQIDKFGGVVNAIEQGYIQKEIQTSSYRYLTEIEKEQRIIVGVNKYAEQEDQKPELLKIDFKLQEDQIRALHKLKQQRDNEAVKNALVKLKNVADSTQNVMPAILHAVKVYATLGEICNVLREIFGEYQEAIVL